MEAKRLPVFSQRLLELQGEMNQAKFAEVLGISRTSVCLYESGTRIPDALILRKIAQKCHVSADWLLGLSDVKSPDGDLQQVCQYTGLSEDVVSSLHTSPDPDIDIINRILQDSCFKKIVQLISHYLGFIRFDLILKEDVAFSDRAPGIGYREKDGQIAVYPADYKRFLFFKVSEYATGMTQNVYDAKVSELKEATDHAPEE